MEGAANFPPMWDFARVGVEIDGRIRGQSPISFLRTRKQDRALTPNSYPIVLRAQSSTMPRRGGRSSSASS